MTDREQVVYDIERCICHVPDACRDCSKFNTVGGNCTEDLLSDALALIREQEPRMLTVKEVKRICADNIGAWSSEDLTILWIEEIGKNYGIMPVVAKWDEDDWDGEPNDIVYAYYFGSDLDEKVNLNEYNRTWRLWTDKPTKTQRMGAAWDA